MTPRSDRYDVLVVGGGFFGLYISEYYGLQGKKVLVCERSSECMTRASYNNQARVHSGYHYPRSMLTAMRSCISFPRFVSEFPDCVYRDFEKYYAIGKILGKVTARQFENFCHRIGAPCEEAPSKITRLFNPHFIEAVFTTREYAFDAAKLRLAMIARAEAAGVEIVTGCTVEKVSDGPTAVLLSGERIAADKLYNCTYSHLNYIAAHSGMPLIPLKHEMTEMALVEVPEELEHRGITVMCGPFFSIMPFPDRGLYTFSHVRHTPHYEWYDQDGKDYCSSYQIYDLDPKESLFENMRLDAARYLPAAGKCRYRDSLWEIKTVLPASEVDDGRPILFKANCGMKHFHSVMGGKIDNIYDVIAAIEAMEGAI